MALRLEALPGHSGAGAELGPWGTRWKVEPQAQLDFPSRHLRLPKSPHSKPRLGLSDLRLPPAPEVKCENLGSRWTTSLGKDQVRGRSRADSDSLICLEGENWERRGLPVASMAVLEPETEEALGFLG